MRDLDGNVLPASKVYYIEARDSSGEIASKGRVLAEKAQRALRLFVDEGWDVTITPVIEQT
ncbi:MAG: hypothetical protein EBU08_10380 [Micrococcales bacterium]|nr:hypothetical protein [Micrococcales bacterium]